MTQQKRKIIMSFTIEQEDAKYIEEKAIKNKTNASKELRKIIEEAREKE